MSSKTNGEARGRRKVTSIAEVHFPTLPPRPLVRALITASFQFSQNHTLGRPLNNYHNQGQCRSNADKMTVSIATPFATEQAKAIHNT